MLKLILLLGGIILNCCATKSKTIILVTTTSVRDTGLLDVIVDTFQKKTGCILSTIAVGTGQALKMGQDGEADILLTHSPDDEKEFMDKGYGINRKTFMHNDFVVLGSKSDIAKIKGEKNVVDVFKKIARLKVLFISRGDNSGTHIKEKNIWKEAEVFPDKNNYVEVGQGMASTLRVADEKQGYVLCDRATYLSIKNTVNLVVLYDGDPLLMNYYSIILVNPARFPKINFQGAKALFDFLLSADSKNIIERFGKDKFGQQLFFWDYK